MSFSNFYGKTDEVASHKILSKAQSLDFLKVNSRFQKINLEYNTSVTNNFRDYASDLNTSAASLAIAWILEQGKNIIAIPGTRSIEHLIEHAEGPL